MSYEIDRYEDGYLLTLLPPLVPQELEIRGLSSRTVESKLRELGAFDRDTIEAIWAADDDFVRGTSDHAREMRAISRRAADGTATDQDVDALREEIRTNTLGWREAGLINRLYMAGQREESIEGACDLLARTEKWDEAEVALNLLSEWSPETFERVAVPFIRGVAWDRGGTQGWAMIYAGKLLREGHAVGLLEEIARLALRPDGSFNTRRDARLALADAVRFDLDWREHLAFKATDSEVEQVVGSLRERLSR